MLQALSIRDVVLVERLDLSFRSGLCVLTGETGAGKSILLDALGLGPGARGDAIPLLHGPARVAAAAAFDLAKGQPAAAILAEQGIRAEESLARRRVLG